MSCDHGACPVDVVHVICSYDISDDHRPCPVIVGNHVFSDAMILGHVLSSLDITYDHKTCDMTDHRRFECDARRAYPVNDGDVSSQDIAHARRTCPVIVEHASSQGISYAHWACRMIIADVV